MTKPGAGKLSDEDRIIWTKVARTARPLKGKPPLPADEPQADDRAALEALLDEKAPTGRCAPAEAARAQVAARSSITSTSRRATSLPRAGCRSMRASTFTA